MNARVPQTWIPVQVKPGLFDTEYAVFITLKDGNCVSLYADKSIVQQKGSDHFLKVYLVNRFPDLQKQRVLLPSETFETMSRWVEVPY